MGDLNDYRASPIAPCARHPHRRGDDGVSEEDGLVFNVCHVVCDANLNVMDGFIERVDITNPIITTRSGAGVGSSEADLVELFGDALEVEEIPGGRQITFVPTDASDRAFRIIWVTDGQFVVSMRAGRTAMVTPWAPCG